MNEPTDDNDTRLLQEILDQCLVDNLNDPKQCAHHIQKAIELIKGGTVVNSNDNTSWDLFIFAVHEEQNDLAKLLIEKGLGVHSTTLTDKKQTPLHLAAGAGNIEMVQYLKDHQADVKALNAEGKTPAEWAQKKGYLDVIAILSSSAPRPK